MATQLLAYLGTLACISQPIVSYRQVVGTQVCRLAVYARLSFTRERPFIYDQTLGVVAQPGAWDDAFP